WRLRRGRGGSCLRCRRLCGWCALGVQRLGGDCGGDGRPPRDPAGSHDASCGERLTAFPAARCAREDRKPSGRPVSDGRTDKPGEGWTEERTKRTLPDTAGNARTPRDPPFVRQRAAGPVLKEDRLSIRAE